MQLTHSKSELYRGTYGTDTRAIAAIDALCEKKHFNALGEIIRSRLNMESSNSVSSITIKVVKHALQKLKEAKKLNVLIEYNLGPIIGKVPELRDYYLNFLRVA